MKNIFFLFVALMSLTLSAQEITYVAHRGASYLAPENTTASIQLAWELDAPAAECDIMLTADHKIILFHDKKGKRLTGHNFVVEETNYDEIKDFTILLKKTNLEQYAGETIPLLSDVLSTIPPGKTLVIEIKTGPEILPYMQEVIGKYWKTGNVAFIAFDLETILKTKEIYPEIPCYYLSAFRNDVKKNFDVIAESTLDGVNLRHKIIDAALVQQFRDVNKDMWCWTVDEPEDARKLIDAGVTAITTNRPKWLSEMMMQ